MCKIRYGFVSNSSSSSFILPVNGDDLEIRIPVDQLVDMINDSNDEGDATLIIDIADLDICIKNMYGWEDKSVEEILESDEYATNLYTTIKEYLDEGKSVVVGNVAYHDEIVAEIIQRNGGSIGG